MQEEYALECLQHCDVNVISRLHRTWTLHTIYILLRLGAQGRPKGASGCQKIADRRHNGSKRSQKSTKIIRKSMKQCPKIR